ncbi:MAG: hypothetical protein IJS08_00770 [Victivallales bacterium]|nr:hypothetical protein [Victivallales bacterium]
MCKAVEDLKAIGRDEGIAIGIGKGRTEGIETVAANALKMGMQPNVVEEITGLPPLRVLQIAQAIRLGGIC